MFWDRVLLSQDNIPSCVRENLPSTYKAEGRELVGRIKREHESCPVSGGGHDKTNMVKRFKKSSQ